MNLRNLLATFLCAAALTGQSTETLLFEDFDSTPMQALPEGWKNENVMYTFITYPASWAGTEPWSGENLLYVISSWAGDNDNIVYTPKLALKKGEKCTFSVMVKTMPQAGPNSFKIKVGNDASREAQSVTLLSVADKEYTEWTKLTAEFTPETEELWCFSISVLNPKAYSSYAFFDDVKIEGVKGTATPGSTSQQGEVLKVPHSESFDNENHNYDGTTYIPANWKAVGDNPFFTANIDDLPAHGGDYYLINDQSADEKNDCLYSPMFELEGGTTYAVGYFLHVDGGFYDGEYSYPTLTLTAGADQDADFQTVKLQEISNHRNDGWEERIALFTPEESGEFCFAWRVEGGPQCGYVALDDFSIVENGSLLKPRVDFAPMHVYAASTRDIVVFGSTPVEFVNATKNADSFQWVVTPEASVDVADNGDALITFGNSGSYKITLTATNESGETSLSKSFDVRVVAPGESLDDLSLTTQGAADKLLSRGSVPAFDDISNYDYITGPNRNYRTIAQRIWFPAETTHSQLVKIGVVNTELRYKPVDNNYTDQYNQPIEFLVCGATGDGMPDLSKTLASVQSTMAEIFGTKGMGSRYGNEIEIKFDSPVDLDGAAFVVVRYSEGVDLVVDDVAAGCSYAALAAVSHNSGRGSLAVLPSGEDQKWQWLDHFANDKSGYGIALTMWIAREGSTDSLTAVGSECSALFAATCNDGYLVVSGLSEGESLAISDLLGRQLACAIADNPTMRLRLPEGFRGVVVVATPSGNAKVVVR